MIISKSAIRLSFLIVIFLNLVSCSVYMATKQPEKKDLSVLNIGTARSHVIAELGAPIISEETEDGKMDIYKFVQGYIHVRDWSIWIYF